MSRLSVRWPVLSFLDLFCCALGGAVITLLLISREIQSQAPSTRLLRMTADVELYGEGLPSLSVSRYGTRGFIELQPDPVVLGNAKRRLEDKMWGDASYPEKGSGRTLFFVYDAAG